MRLSGWCAVVLALSFAPSALAQDDSSPQSESPQTPDTASAPSSTSQPSEAAPSPGPAPIDLFTAKPPEKTEETVSHGAGGFELGLRIVAQLPLGDTFKGTSLKSMVSGQAAAQLDLGWRINPAWEVGAFARYGLAFVNGCTDTVSCSSYDVGVGLEGELHLLPDASFDPWIGLGVGYEFLTLSSSGAPTPPLNVEVETSVTYKGATFAVLDVGADYRLTDTLGAGPYVEASLGQFTTNDGGDLLNKSLHLWLGLGLRGWFDIR